VSEEEIEEIIRRRLRERRERLLRKVEKSD
jgi:hypothetical protein